ncbi:hypothetical protein D9M73_83340 [compost metagenome]
MFVRQHQQVRTTGLLRNLMQGVFLPANHTHIDTKLLRQLPGEMRQTLLRIGTRRAAVHIGINQFEKRTLLCSQHGGTFQRVMARCRKIGNSKN